MPFDLEPERVETTLELGIGRREVEPFVGVVEEDRPQPLPIPARFVAARAQELRNLGPNPFGETRLRKRRHDPVRQLDEATDLEVGRRRTTKPRDRLFVACGRRGLVGDTRKDARPILGGTCGRR